MLKIRARAPLIGKKKTNHGRKEQTVVFVLFFLAHIFQVVIYFLSGHLDICSQRHLLGVSMHKYSNC